MKVSIPGVIHQSVERIPDDRGYFSEIFRTGSLPESFVQANHSYSRAGVVRGLHYHRRQADLWYLATGHIRVVLVDLRTPGGTPESALLEMRAESPSTLYIPPGIAHGFAAISDCDLIYWVSEEFDASDEFGVAWDDPSIGIDWGVEDPMLSERDRNHPPLRWEDVPSF